MGSKIKDLVEIAPLAVADESARGPASALSAFLLTYELGDALARIVDRLVSRSDGQRNCLIVGSSGCGKSTLLAVTCDLLGLPASTDLGSRFAEIRMSVDDETIHPLHVEWNAGDRRLSASIERAVREFCHSEGLPFRGTGDDEAARLRLDVVASAVANLPHGHRIVLAIDDLDDWLRSVGRYAYENIQTMTRLGELSRELPLATCAVAGGGVLADDAASGEGQGWMASLHEDFQIVYVPSHTVRTATASRVLKKNARQRREILEVLGKLREKLPDLNYSDEEFVELYPLEVSTWTIGGHLHRWIEGFSFPEFAARAAESVRGRPKLSLFALNDMFSRYEGELRRVESIEPIFAAYDRLQTDALPKLGSSQRLWASLALQSIFMHTIAGFAVDVTTLTNSVLLYSLHGSGSSYVYMGAVLKQLEALARGEIVASGEGTSRRYSLVSGQSEAVRAKVEELADAIDDEEELAWALASFGGHYFADWPLGEMVPGPVRGDMWEIAQQPGAITLQARTPSSDGDASSPRPRLVMLAPGRTWSEARDEAMRSNASSVWLGGVATPDGRQSLKNWIAVTRLSANEQSGRYSDLESFRRELVTQCSVVFRRVYIERGMLVTAWRSDPMSSLVNAAREENLIVRLLPSEAVASAAVATAAAPAAPSNVAESVRWLAHLTADTPDEVKQLAAITDTASWLQRLEAWYAAGINRDVSHPVALLGESESAEASAALEAKHQFDVALFNVRKALSAGSLTGLRQSLTNVFDTPEKLWAAREWMDWLGRFAAWLATIELAARYLRDAETVEDSDAEELRRTALAWVDKLDGFADEQRRAAFDDAFQTFRDVYTTYYASEHNRSVDARVIDTVSDALLGSRSWRALEALSGLPIGDPTYLVEATNLVSSLREAQCDADVPAVLTERPRCVCGFRLGDRTRLTALAASVRDLVASGIEHHRRLLQQRKSELRAKLKARKTSYAVETIRSIAALTGDDELPEIDAAMIAALNDLLESRSV